MILGRIEQCQQEHLQKAWKRALRRRELESRGETRYGTQVLEGMTKFMNLDLIFEPKWLLFALLLIPFLLWGVYLLRLRLTYHVQINPNVQALTILAVLLFYLYEVHVLEVWLRDSNVAFLLSTISLFVAAAALYGPIAFSFASHFVTDMIMPKGYWAAHEPQYGGAEGLEEQGNFEDAARAYIALARTFPAEAKPALRAADNLMKVGRPEEAVEWFERGFAKLASPQESLPVANRLFQIYAKTLREQEPARQILEAYVERFPNAEYADSVRARLERFNAE